MTPKSIAGALPIQKNRSLLPSAPQRVEDTGLDFSFLVELLTKTQIIKTAVGFVGSLFGGGTTVNMAGWGATGICTDDPRAMLERFHNGDR